MTPIPSKERLAARQLYDPVPGSVTAEQLIDMDHRKKKHLSDWAVGCLMLGIQRGEITKKQADIFQTPFMRGAKIRKNREHGGEAFLGPGDKVMTIGGVRYHGDDDSLKEGPALALEEVHKEPGYEAWVAAFFTGKMPEGEWDSEKSDSSTDDEQEPRPKKAKRSKNTAKVKKEVIDSEDEEIPELEVEEGHMVKKQQPQKKTTNKRGAGLKLHINKEIALSEDEEEGPQLNAAGHPTTGGKTPEMMNKIRAMSQATISPAGVPKKHPAALSKTPTPKKAKSTKASRSIAAKKGAATRKANKEAKAKMALAPEGDGAGEGSAVSMVQSSLVGQDGSPIPFGLSLKYHKEG